MRSRTFIPFLAALANSRPGLLPREFASTGDEPIALCAQQWYSKNEVATANSKNVVQKYTCNGMQMAQMPPQQEWFKFEDLWQINVPQITKKNGVSTYNDILKELIQEASSNTKIDARLILAIVMQESDGNMGVAVTGPADTGLMQMRTGRAFNVADPRGSITNMLNDGIYGTAGYPGFLTLCDGQPDYVDQIEGNDKGKWKGNPFAAAHIYNSGHIDSLDLSFVIVNGTRASTQYTNDIAARLLGWTDDGTPRDWPCPK